MAKLYVRDGSREWQVELSGRMTIGRLPENQVVLTDTNSSRRHAAVVQEAERWALQDLGSAHGTFLNDAKLIGQRPLSSGDVVRIGSATLRFEEEAVDPSDAATALGLPAFALSPEAQPAARPIPLSSPAPQPAPAIPAPRPVARPSVASPIASPAPVAAVGPNAPFAPFAPAPGPGPGPAPAAAPAFVYAGFWRRFAATLVDGLLIGVPFYFLQRGALGLLGGFGPEIVALGFGLLQLAVALTYFARWESSAGGATFGKKLLGLRVVDDAGRRVGFGKALARNLGKLLSGAICGLGFLFVAFTTRKCAWHDTLAGCLVVRGSSVPAGAALRPCGACGWSPRPGLSFCTQCGQRLG